MNLPLKNGSAATNRGFLLLTMKFCLLLCIAMPPIQAKSQSNSTQSISGQINDEGGAPLEGVTVQLKGSRLSTITNGRGEFLLKVPQTNSGILVITSIGYLDKEFPFTSNGAPLAIQLNKSDKTLDQVVVVGYGKQKKATLTGSVTQINADEIKQSASVNISNALAGRMPGLITNNRSGEPGSDGSSILIRGAGTTGNTAPLFVIDGVANRSGFERLNPNDIESISVLKDASAAIYGAQAANGVILVTTKRGKILNKNIS
jgi:TonB-dependent SusC/RagA subfamily outer membrane receptor